MISLWFNAQVLSLFFTVHVKEVFHFRRLRLPLKHPYFFLQGLIKFFWKIGQPPLLNPMAPLQSFTKLHTSKHKFCRQLSSLQDGAGHWLVHRIGEFQGLRLDLFISKMPLVFPVHPYCFSLHSGTMLLLAASLMDLLVFGFPNPLNPSQLKLLRL